MSNSIPVSQVSVIILACEAGMGSSLMSVNSLKKKLKGANVQNVTVVHKPVRGIPEDARLVLVHEGLAKTARLKAPNAVIVPFKQFLNDPVFDKVVQAFVDHGEITGI